MAISRSRAPANLSALTRSIGSTARPGISAVSTGMRGGGGGVMGDPSGLAVEPVPFATGKATAVGTDYAAIPSCLPGGTVVIASLARRTTGSLVWNRVGGGIEEAGFVAPCAGADAVPGATDWPDAGLETSPQIACVIRISITDARGAENLLVSRIRLMSRSLLAPEELREVQDPSSWFFPNNRTSSACSTSRRTSTRSRRCLTCRSPATGRTGRSRCGTLPHSAVRLCRRRSPTIISSRRST